MRTLSLTVLLASAALMGCAGGTPERIEYRPGETGEVLRLGPSGSGTYEVTKGPSPSRTEIQLTAAEWEQLTDQLTDQDLDALEPSDAPKTDFFPADVLKVDERTVRFYPEANSRTDAEKALAVVMADARRGSK